MNNSNFQVILLLAGESKRLRPLTDQTPKCLLDVGGQTILERNLSLLSHHAWSHITLVTGFCAEKIEKAASHSCEKTKIIFCENKIYHKTNNAYSLFLALNQSPLPFILMDGDLIIDPDILNLCLKSPHENLMMIDERQERLTEEAMKAVSNMEGKIKLLSKKTPPQKAKGEYIGLSRFGQKTTHDLLNILKQTSLTEFETAYYEDILNRLLQDNTHVISGVSTEEKDWIEIDTQEDLEEAREKIKRI